MPLRVLSPGLFSLPVGLARPGRRALGVPPGGAADVANFMLGNALLGNDPHTPAVELTLLGPTLRAESDTGCVVFGAPFEITRGERIAQLVVQRVEHVVFREVDELDESDRGEGGFGHTGR